MQVRAEEFVNRVAEHACTGCVDERTVAGNVHTIEAGGSRFEQCRHFARQSLGDDIRCVKAVVRCAQLLSETLLFGELSLQCLLLDLQAFCCLLYTSPSPRDGLLSRM